MIKWAVIFLLVLCGSASAQQINVRSGAHDSFARLVFDVPPGTTWEVESLTTGARIAVNGHSAGFDISTVFDRIDGSYISGVSADNSAVTVDFSCDCSAQVFAQGPRMIVMDISAASQPAVREATTDFSLNFVGQQPLRFQAIQGQQKTSLQAPPQVTPISDFGAIGRIPPRQNTMQPANDSQEFETNSERLQLAQKKLSRQIGVAATRGVLAPSGRGIDAKLSTTKPQIDTRIFDSSSPDETNEPMTEPVSGNIRITSSADIPSLGGRQLPTSTNLGIPCIDPAVVAVQHWGSDGGLPPKLATLRSSLFGEFDRLDHDVAVQLAKTFLHYGFGAEAKQILMMDDALAQAHPALASIAEIMEHGHSRDSKYLRHFMDCESDLALWAILSVPELNPSATININAALLSLSGLPKHLRNFIAPELSRRLLAYGNEDGAAAALRSLERGPEALSPNANLAKADLEMSQGNTEKAQDRLSEVVASNAEQSAEALIKFVDSHLAEDAEIDEEVATLVEAYAIEMRNDPIGEDLRRTHVLALGKSGQFSEAFEALSRVRARNIEMTEDILRSSVLDLLVRSASDVEFLDHSFAQMTIAPDTILPSTRFGLAERLAELGFHEQAEIILNAGPRFPNSAKTALLMAEISLALERPQEALAHLFGETSEAATLLRARAEKLSGDYSEAFSIYASLGDESNSGQAAWLSDEWSLLVEEGAPVFGPVVRVAQSTLENPPQLEGMLDRAATAIAESQEARQVIRDLLNSDALATEAN